jgi:hypothetical protein
MNKHAIVSKRADVSEGWMLVLRQALLVFGWLVSGWEYVDEING